jgi:hypothetical protein
VIVRDDEDKVYIPRRCLGGDEAAVNEKGHANAGSPDLGDEDFQRRPEARAAVTTLEGPEPGLDLLQGTIMDARGQQAASI